MLRGVVILACVLVACGGATKPGATVTGSARPAVAADAIDADAPFRLGVDFATLRKTGWHDVVADVVARMSDHDSWSALQRDCRFVLRRDARTVEESSDERGERIVAVEPLEPLDDKLACIRSTVREGFFTKQQMTKLGRARAEVVEGLLLIGSERAIREAKRRLGVDRESTPPRQRLLWLSIEKTENETYTLLVTGDASKLSVRHEVNFARGAPPAEPSVRKSLDELASVDDTGDASREFVRAIRGATVAIEGQSVVVTVELRSTPQLADVVGRSVARWWKSNDKVRQCNRLIDVINREQQPLKSASGSDPDALDKLARVLNTVADNVGAVGVSDASLIGFRDEYAKMARDLAVASSKTAFALRSNDPKLAAAAAEDMGSFGPRESNLVDAINRYCFGSVPEPPVAETESAAATEAPATKVHIPIAAWSPRAGPEHAKVTIIAFVDMQCPHCTVTNTLKQVADAYPKVVSVHLRHFPLPMHPDAEPSARAIQAARRQGKAWPMAEKLLADRRAQAPADVTRYAAELGLNATKFNADLGSKRVAEEVLSDLQAGTDAGIRGTPTIFINGTRYIGRRTVEGFKEVVDAELQRADALLRSGTPLKKVYESLSAPP